MPLLNSQKLIRLYYAATVVFLVIDYLFSLSFRATFLDDSPFWKAAYYGLCLAILFVISWRPKFTEILAAAESLITVSALTLSMAVRVMVPSSNVIDSGYGAVTASEVVNFVLSGSVAWIAWQRSLKRLSRTMRGQ